MVRYKNPLPYDITIKDMTMLRNGTLKIVFSHPIRFPSYFHAISNKKRGRMLQPGGGGGGGGGPGGGAAGGGPGVVPAAGDAAVGGPGGGAFGPGAAGDSGNAAVQDNFIADQEN